MQHAKRHTGVWGRGAWPALPGGYFLVGWRRELDPDGLRLTCQLLLVACSTSSITLSKPVVPFETPEAAQVRFDGRRVEGQLPSLCSQYCAVLMSET